MHEKSEIIAFVCVCLDTGDRQNAVDLLKRNAAFDSISKQSKRKGKFSLMTDSAMPKIITKRQYTMVQSTRVFIDDGFIDRYDGERLIFPGVLRLLSDIFPNEFPYHPNWKAGACHQWYWELFPTVDHVVPVTRTGVKKDNPENWVTTSMLNNLSKSNTTLENLGWTLVPKGNYGQWDGLLRWFVRYTDKNTTVVQKNYMKSWRNAAINALKSL
jgi:hypothetical protein